MSDLELIANPPEAQLRNSGSSPLSQSQRISTPEGKDLEPITVTAPIPHRLSHEELDRTSFHEEETTSSSITAKSSSVLRTGNTLLHGSTNRIFEALEQVAFTTQRRSIWGETVLNNAAFFLILLQSVSFALEPSFFYASDDDRSASFSDGPVPQRILRVFQHIRGLLDPSWPFALASAIFLSGAFVFKIFAMLMSMNNSGRFNFKFIRWYKLMELFGVLASPLMASSFILWFQRGTPSSGLDIGMTAVSALGLAIHMFDWGEHVLFHFDVRPAWSMFAESLPRQRYFRWLITLSLIGLQSGMGFGGRRLLPGWAKILQAVLTAILFGADFISQVIFMSWYKKLVNEIRAGFLLGCVSISIFAIIATAVPSAGPWLLLVSVICFFPCVLLGAFIQRLRLRWILRLSDKFYLASLSNAPAGDTSDDPVSVPFKFPYDIDLAIRFLYQTNRKSGAISVGRGVTSDLIHKAQLLIEGGLRDFPTSPQLQIIRAIYQIEIKGDQLHARQAITEALKLHPLPDLKYMCFCLWESLNGKDSEEDDLAINLADARIHHILAKKAISDFWTKVYRSKGITDDVKPLTAAIAKLDFHEQTANEAFKELSAKYPNSVEVMRAYAFFLSDITDEKETSEELLEIANEMEDQQTKARTLKQRRMVERRKKHQSGNQQTINGGVKFQTTSELDQEQLDTSELDSKMVPTRSASVPLGQIVGNTHNKGHISETPIDTRSEAGLSMIDSVSEAGGSGISGESRAKILQFRHKISQSKSKGIAFLKLGTYSGWSLLFILAIVLVILALIFSDNAHKSTSNMDSFMTMQNTLADVLVVIRCGGSCTVTSASVDKTIAQLDLGYQDVKIHFGSSKYLKKAVEVWMPIKDTFPIQKVFLNTSLWEALDVAILETKQALRQLAENVSMENSTAAFYLLDNLVQVIIDPVLNAANLEITSQMNYNTSLLAALYAMLALITVSGFISFFALYLPMTKKLKKEQQSAFSMFTDLPKSSCANEMMKHSTELEKMEKLYKSQRSVGQKSAHDSFRDIGLVTVAVILLLIAAGLMADISLIYDVTVQPDHLNGLVLQSIYKQSIFETMFMAHESFDSDLNITYIGTKFQAAHELFLAKSTEYTNLVNSISIGDVNNILFGRPCPGFEDSCLGLLQLNKLLINTAVSLYYNPDPVAGLKLWNEAIPLYDASSSWMEEIQALISSQDADISNSVIIVSYVGLSLGICVVFAAYLVTRAWYKSLEVQLMRGLQLLLSLPLSMLLSIDSIHHFLEQGFTEFQQSSGSISQDHEQATKAILEGSQDGIVIVTESMDISFFNPAAEDLTGHKAAEVLGKCFLPLIDQKTGKKLQADVRNFLEKTKSSKRFGDDKRFTWRNNENDDLSSEPSSLITKEGREIPVLISGVNSRTAGGMQFAFFIKDIQVITDNQKQQDALLHNILPDAVVDTLRKNPEADVSAEYKSVTVLFADIVEFTPKAAKLSPHSLVGMLNNLFSRWDVLCEENGIEKIKTIGDCFMCAAGVPVACDDHAERMLKFAIAALKSLGDFNREDHGDEKWPQLQVRIGINSGPSVAGVIGKTKFQYDLWGDAVNTASRVETNGLANRIQVSKTTYMLTKDLFKFKSRGMITLKGKGDQECFLLEDDEPSILSIVSLGDKIAESQEQLKNAASGSGAAAAAKAICNSAAQSPHSPTSMTLKKIGADLKRGSMASLISNGSARDSFRTILSSRVSVTRVHPLNPTPDIREPTIDP